MKPISLEITRRSRFGPTTRQLRTIRRPAFRGIFTVRDAVQTKRDNEARAARRARRRIADGVLA